MKYSVVVLFVTFIMHCSVKGCGRFSENQTETIVLHDKNLINIICFHDDIIMITSNYLNTINIDSQPTSGRLKLYRYSSNLKLKDSNTLNLKNKLILDCSKLNDSIFYVSCLTDYSAKMLMSVSSFRELPMDLSITEIQYFFNNKGRIIDSAIIESYLKKSSVNLYYGIESEIQEIRTYEMRDGMSWGPIKLRFPRLAESYSQLLKKYSRLFYYNNFFTKECNILIGQSSIPSGDTIIFGNSDNNENARVSKRLLHYWELYLIQSDYYAYNSASVAFPSLSAPQGDLGGIELKYSYYFNESVRYALPPLQNSQVEYITIPILEYKTVIIGLQDAGLQDNQQQSDVSYTNLAINMITGKNKILGDSTYLIRSSICNNRTVFLNMFKANTIASDPSKNIPSFKDNFIVPEAHSILSLDLLNMQPSMQKTGQSLLWEHIFYDYYKDTTIYSEIVGIREGFKMRLKDGMSLIGISFPFLVYYRDSDKQSTSDTIVLKLIKL